MAALSIAEQDRRIRAAWPGFRTIIASERLGIWRGGVQGLSHPYTVEIVYARNRHGDPFRYAYAPFPEVTVLDPPLSRRAEDPNDPIPHVYIDPDRAHPVLCLFDPRAKGWGRHEAIADTILAWTASWLRFYEAWQATGVWTGGGAPHGPMARPPAETSEAVDLAAPAADAQDRRRALLGSASIDVLTAAIDAAGTPAANEFGYAVMTNVSTRRSRGAVVGVRTASSLSTSHDDAPLPLWQRFLSQSPNHEHRG